ncbi:hypothetical protein ACWNXI_18210 [Caldibacillus thermoamylovorans]
MKQFRHHEKDENPFAYVRMAGIFTIETTCRVTEAVNTYIATKEGIPILLGHPLLFAFLTLRLRDRRFRFQDDELLPPAALVGFFVPF